MMQIIRYAPSIGEYCKNCFAEPGAPLPYKPKKVDTSRRGDTIRAVNSKKIEGRKTWLTGRR